MHRGGAFVECYIAVAMPFAAQAVLSARLRHPLALVQHLDLKTYLVDDINTKVDRASMAHGLETREPLMDHPLVEWLATVPSTFKLSNGESKKLLKSAMEPYLPQELLYRPKMGFAVPLAAWFRGPLKARVRDALLGERLGGTGWFNRSVMQTLIQAHEDGRQDHSSALWSFLMFDAFLKRAESGASDLALLGVNPAPTGSVGSDAAGMTVQ